MLKVFEKSTFDDHVVEREIYDKVCGETPYWLWRMDLWLKPKEE